MYKAFIVLVAVCVAACCPCRDARMTQTVSVEQHDTSRIVHYDTLRHIVIDTMQVMPLAQHHERVMVRASTSHLSNSYCWSTASVDSAGILTHTLDTRDSALLPMRTIATKRSVRDSVYRLSRSSEAEDIGIIKERKVNHITWWQRTQIIALWVIVAALVIKLRKVIIKVISGWRI